MGGLKTQKTTLVCLFALFFLPIVVMCEHYPDLVKINSLMSFKIFFSPETNKHEKSPEPDVTTLPEQWLQWLTWL